MKQHRHHVHLPYSVSMDMAKRHLPSKALAALIITTALATLAAQSGTTSLLLDSSLVTICPQLPVYALKALWNVAGSSRYVSLPTNTKQRIFSIEPLMIHVEDFISTQERQYLLDLAAPHLEPSMVNNASGSRIYLNTRTSTSAYLPRADPIVTRLAQRAVELQGFVTPRSYVDVQVTKYEPGQYYHAHNDWFLTRNEGNPRDRLSTFFLILEADCNDCGTQFLSLKAQWESRSPKWCKYFDCMQEVVTTRNIAGSGLFWINLDANGDGRPEMLHAGMTVPNGTKVGLNIWTEVELE